jgi:hypothetical protein
MRNRVITALKKVLASYDEWNGLWVHYTNVNKLGVNPQQFHQDPAGIYLFPKEFEVKGHIWKEKKFKIIVSIKPDISILDLAKITKQDMQEILDKLGIKYHEDVFKDVDEWWEHLKGYYSLTGKKLAGKWNKDFRSLGYDAIFDDTGSIHTNEIQLLVLNPNVLKVEDVETQNIKRGQFSRLEQFQAKLKELLEPHGKVDATPVKKYKDWIGKDKRLKARLKLNMVTDDYVEFEIEEDERNHTMWVRVVSTNLKSFKDNWGSISLSDNLDRNDEKRLKAFVTLVMKKVNQPPEVQTQ